MMTAAHPHRAHVRSTRWPWVPTAGPQYPEPIWLLRNRPAAADPRPFDSCACIWV